MSCFAAVSDGRIEPLRWLVWNANSHADRHDHDCPSAPAMQHSGGAALTAASTASHELLSSKHKSSSLAGTTRSAAFAAGATPTRCSAWLLRRRSARRPDAGDMAEAIVGSDGRRYPLSAAQCRRATRLGSPHARRSPAPRAGALCRRTAEQMARRLHSLGSRAALLDAHPAIRGRSQH